MMKVKLLILNIIVVYLHLLINSYMHKVGPTLAGMTKPNIRLVKSTLHDQSSYTSILYKYHICLLL